MTDTRAALTAMATRPQFEKGQIVLAEIETAKYGSGWYRSWHECKYVEPGPDSKDQHWVEFKGSKYYCRGMEVLPLPPYGSQRNSAHPAVVGHVIPPAVLAELTALLDEADAQEEAALRLTRIAADHTAAFETGRAVAYRDAVARIVAALGGTTETTP